MVDVFRRLPPIMPSAAHAELLRQSGELERILDGRGLVFDDPPPPVTPPEPSEPFVIPKADWDQEERERKEREREADEAAFQAELARRQETDHVRGLDPEQLEETPGAHPAPPKRRVWRRDTA